MNRFSPIFTLFLGANIALSADFQVKPSSEFAWAKSAETNNDTSHPTKELLQRTGRDCQNPGYQNSLPQTDSGCLSVHEIIGDAHNSFMTKGPRKATNNTGTKSAASQVVSSPSIPNKVSPKAAIAASEPAKMGKMTFDEACALSPKEETAVKVMKDYLEALNCIDGYQPAICSGVLSAGLYFSLPLVRIKAIRS
ncbi:MAG TPA: hypothetical protein PLU50_03195, partial [Pseudobdellovibrionaceae bacterium]|nr:hypothetical protein [Pseudobdellovibrionaceae bacterium]